MSSIDFAATRPTTPEELAAIQSNLREWLRELVMQVLTRQFELMNAQHYAELFAAVHKTAGELSAAAATWARLSDSIRASWQI